MGPEYSIGYGKFCKREYKERIRALDNAQDQIWRAKVDALIPAAARMAHTRVRRGTATQETIGVDGLPYTADMFSRYFHEEMDRMKRKAGFIS